MVHQSSNTIPILGHLGFFASFTRLLSSLTRLLSSFARFLSSLTRLLRHDFFDTASLTRLLWPASSPSGRGQGGRLHHLPADPGAHHPAAGLSGDHGRRHPRPVRPILRGLWHGRSAAARPWPSAAGSRPGGDDRANSGPGQAQTG